MEAAQVSLEPCVVCSSMAGLCCRICKRPLCDVICAIEHKMDKHRVELVVEAKKR